MQDELGSSRTCLAHYRLLQRQRPDLFSEPSDSPIAILTGDADIAAAQQAEATRRVEQGLRFPDLRVGILAADPYLGALTRDAVRFGDGTLGLYNRHIGESGCVVMPILSGSIVLIRIFRHATREWAWEFPGGRISPNDHPMLTAQHEVEEEIGAIAPVMQSLGNVFPYPAFSNARVHLYVATITQIGSPQIAEGISSIETVPVARLMEMADSGEIRDAAALACILKARLRGII